MLPGDAFTGRTVAAMACGSTSSGQATRLPRVT
jgi:hypothetical protein